MNRQTIGSLCKVKKCTIRLLNFCNSAVERPIFFDTFKYNFKHALPPPVMNPKLLYWRITVIEAIMVIASLLVHMFPCDSKVFMLTSALIF